jgi:hypothetical protein
VVPEPAEGLAEWACRNELSSQSIKVSQRTSRSNLPNSEPRERPKGAADLKVSKANDYNRSLSLPKG